MKLERLLKILVNHIQNRDSSLIGHEYIGVELNKEQMRRIITDLTNKLAAKHGHLLLIASILPGHSAERSFYTTRMTDSYKALYQLFTDLYMPGLARFDVLPPLNASGYITLEIHTDSPDLALALVGYAIPYVENRQRIFGTRKPTDSELRLIVDGIRRTIAGDPMPEHLITRACNLLYDLCSLPMRQEPLAQLREPLVPIIQPPPDLPGIRHSSNGASQPPSEDTTINDPLPLDHLDEDGNTTQMNGTQSTTERIIRGLKRRHTNNNNDRKLRPPVPRPRPKK